MRRSALVLALLLSALALVAAGCGGGEEVTATPETVVGTVPTSTTAECTAPACELEGDADAGKEVFAGSSGCAGCHALADAGASGTVGPNLDETQPTFESSAATITNGRAGMPKFGGQLSDQQIADVAQYIADATAG